MMPHAGRRDPRREPDERGNVDTDVPTDVLSREDGGGGANAVRIRLEVPRVHHDEPDEGENTDVAAPSSSRVPVASAALPRGVRAWLEVETTPHPRSGEQPLELTMVRTVLGRGHEADLRFDDRRLSRKHASILYTGREFRIRDEGSVNGTRLNGSRVVEYALRDDDELVLGNTTLRFHAVARIE